MPPRGKHFSLIPKPTRSAEFLTGPYTVTIFLQIRFLPESCATFSLTFLAMPGIFLASAIALT
jgi:hypothetical protein